MDTVPVPYIKMINGKPVRMIPVSTIPMPTEEISGVLEISGSDAHGVIRPEFRPGDRDVYIPANLIRQSYMRPGDFVTVVARTPKENEKFWGFVEVKKINGEVPEKMKTRPLFHRLTPIYPKEKILLETGKEPLVTRLIDLVAPIGRGQRGLVVSPPKAGKTTILKEIASGI